MCESARAYAHGYDEGPGLGLGTTILLAVFWALIAAVVALFVWRLVRGTRQRHNERDWK